MIFVTVGTQLPFERMIQSVDQWAALHPEVEVVMQTGETVYQPQHCRYTAFTAPAEWDALFSRASLVVSHAGMGTILKSLDYTKPLIIMPRLAEYGEHRNDHQLATAERFKGFSNIALVDNEQAMAVALDNPPTTNQDDKRDNPNLRNLVSALRSFVNDNS